MKKGLVLIVSVFLLIVSCGNNVQANFSKFVPLNASIVMVSQNPKALMEAIVSTQTKIGLGNTTIDELIKNISSNEFTIESFDLTKPCGLSLVANDGKESVVIFIPVKNTKEMIDKLTPQLENQFTLFSQDGYVVIAEASLNYKDSIGKTASLNNMKFTKTNGVTVFVDINQLKKDNADEIQNMKKIFDDELMDSDSLNMTAEQVKLAKTIFSMYFEILEQLEFANIEISFDDNALLYTMDMGFTDGKSIQKVISDIKPGSNVLDGFKYAKDDSMFAMSCDFDSKNLKDLYNVILSDEVAKALQLDTGLFAEFKKLLTDGADLLNGNSTGYVSIDVDSAKLQEGITSDNINTLIDAFSLDVAFTAGVTNGPKYIEYLQSVYNPTSSFSKLYSLVGKALGVEYNFSLESKNEGDIKYEELTMGIKLDDSLLLRSDASAQIYNTLKSLLSNLKIIFTDKNNKLYMTLNNIDNVKELVSKDGYEQNLKSGTSFADAKKLIPSNASFVGYFSLMQVIRKGLEAYPALAMFGDKIPKENVGIYTYATTEKNTVSFGSIVSYKELGVYVQVFQLLSSYGLLNR